MTTTSSSTTTPADVVGAPDGTSPRRRYTLADLEDVAQPWDDTRYEIIDGELFVSSQPSLWHQHTCGQLVACLMSWGQASGLGWAFFAPGLIFAEDDNAAPDVIWLSHERYRQV